MNLATRHKSGENKWHVRLLRCDIYFESRNDIPNSDWENTNVSDVIICVLTSKEFQDSTMTITEGLAAFPILWFN